MTTAGLGACVALIVWPLWSLYGWPAAALCPLALACLGTVMLLWVAAETTHRPR